MFMFEDSPFDSNVAPWGWGSLDPNPKANPCRPVVDVVGVEEESRNPEQNVEATSAPESSESETTTSSDTTGGTPNGISFLSLPFEVRLQIYGWVHRMTPVKHAQLAPWYPTPTYSAYFLKAIMPDMDLFAEVDGSGLAADGPSVDNTFRAVLPSDSDSDACSIASSSSPSRTASPSRSRRRRYREQQANQKLLSPHRPLSGLPSALLRANRQMYDEARGIPFAENEFVFVNWFSSGLWAARAFTRGLKPWQRESMRYARLELLARDLAGNGLREWKDLCDLWAVGMRGLRLKILVGGGVFGTHFGDGEVTIGSEALDMRDLTTKDWIEDGVKKLSSLRTLEIELCVKEWSARTKIEWCATLQDTLNADRPEGQLNVAVICVEKANAPMVAKEVPTKVVS